MAIQLKGNDTSTYSDGATFAGDVNIDRPASIPSSARGIAIAQDGNVTAEINLAGSATFGDFDNHAGVRINFADQSGNVACDRTDGTQGVFYGKLNGDTTTTILANGSASFAGAITAEGRDVPTYQQGVWTPEFVYASGGSGWLGNTFSSGPFYTTGFWTRTGNMVYFQYYPGNFELSSGTGQQARINNLPYAASSGGGNSSYGIFNITYSDAFNAVSAGAISTGYVEAGQTYMFPCEPNSRVSATWASSGVTMMIAGSYITDNTDWTPINGATVS